MLFYACLLSHIPSSSDWNSAKKHALWTFRRDNGTRVTVKRYVNNTLKIKYSPNCCLPLLRRTVPVFVFVILNEKWLTDWMMERQMKRGQFTKWTHPLQPTWTRRQGDKWKLRPYYSVYNMQNDDNNNNETCLKSIYLKLAFQNEWEILLVPCHTYSEYMHVPFHFRLDKQTAHATTALWYRFDQPTVPFFIKNAHCPMDRGFLVRKDYRVAHKGLF